MTAPPRRVVVVTAAIDAFGRIDVLADSAGTFATAPLGETDAAGTAAPGSLTRSWAVELADATVHLASSPYVTGQVLAVDGGLSVA